MHVQNMSKSIFSQYNNLIFTYLVIVEYKFIYIK